MKLTIFTPTYNRKHLLKGLYDSICMAHLKNRFRNRLEWLIVDDGSYIDISDEVNKFYPLQNMSIRLIQKKNGGKHTAFNKAIEESSGELFMCVDDDDRLTENAILDIISEANKYDICSGKSKYGAIVGRVINIKGKLLGKNIKNIPIISNTIQIRDKYHFWGEPEVYVLSKLKEYRFPIFENENFLTEAYLFDSMSKKYPFIYTNIQMMIKNYLPGGLTDNQLRIRVFSPNGTEAYYRKRKELSENFLSILKATINRQRFSFWCKRKIEKKKDIYEIVASPMSYLMYLKDKKQIEKLQKK